MGNFTAVVIDFETTGLSPHHGDRTIEVGAVAVHNNRIIDRFQSLMNPGMRVSTFIEAYTGITNSMLANAPPVAEVISRLSEFIGNYPLVAHNASFDARFLEAEQRRIEVPARNPFACSMLIARRVYPHAPDHKLETLVRYKRLRTNGIHHRALEDAEMTAHLWLEIIADVKREYDLECVTFPVLQQLGRVSRKKVREFLEKQR